MKGRKNTNNRRQNQKKALRPRSRSMTSMNPRIISHIGMVADPCNAPLGSTAYRGQDGFLNRFSSQVNSINTGAETAGIVAYWPRMNRIFSQTLALSSTGFSLDFYNASFSSAGPGNAFLGTNAAEARPVAACISTSFAGAEVERQGIVGRGVLPLKSTTGTVTVANLMQVLNEWDRTSNGTEETKWIPTPDNENYSPILGVAPTTTEDDNIIVVLFTGFGGSRINFVNRITCIQEWVPFYGLGIGMPIANTPDVPGGLEIVRTTLASAGKWWLHSGAAEQSGRLLARIAAAGAGRVAMKLSSALALPMLM